MYAIRSYYAAAGVTAAQTLSIPIFIAANIFIGYLTVRTTIDTIQKARKIAR